jgi:hypothetical protein
MHTPLFMCGLSWQLFLDSASPAVVALLSATALWVASRTRSTSKGALSTLWAQPALDRRRRESPESNGSAPTAPDRRK